MNSGAFLPFAALPGFSPAFQAEFADYIKAQLGAQSDEEIGAGPAQTDESEEPSDLSVAQAKKFLDRVSDKVRSTLRVIAEADPAGFEMKAVRRALGLTDEDDLRGVWGGITKRVRTVLGDDEAYLIWWIEQEHDWIGRVSQMTHRSLGKALGI